MDTPETLRSRLYRLEQHNEEDIWVEKCQGYPVFRKEDSIFKLKYYSLPNRELSYDITVNSNVRFDRNENGVEWIQIREGEIMAISFREQFHANAFWNLIDDYQKKYEVSVPTASGTHFYFEYRVPDPTVNNLPEFLAELERIPEAERHERLTSILLTKRQFLPRLCSVFKQLQRTNPVPLNKLELMFTILKIIFNSSNEELLYELMCDQFFLFILGAFEYDPNFRNARPKHRDFIRNKSKLIPVVSFKNNQLLNLSVITYRLEYVRECILLPYLNDYSFAFTSHIIRNNYRKILSHIFSPRRQDFINQLFDHLRRQEPMAFRLLQEIFRIGKSFYAEDLYKQIAGKDFFDIMVRSIKDLKQSKQKKGQTQPPQVAQQGSNKYKRKRKPQDIETCVEISIEILEQFMQFGPLYFKNYCVSESEVVNKYPAINFLLGLFQQNSLPRCQTQLQIILKILVTDKQEHPIKSIVYTAVLDKMLDKESNVAVSKWVPLLNKILFPFKFLYINFSHLVKAKLAELKKLLMSSIFKQSKEHQINILQTVKTLINVYIDNQDGIQNYMSPYLEEYVDYFVKSRGGVGIRMSIFLSIFKNPIFKEFNQIIVNCLFIKIKRLEERNSVLLSVYISTLQGFINRKEVTLPSNLRRERSEQLKDDQCFEKIQKMIKID